MTLCWGAEAAAGPAAEAHAAEAADGRQHADDGQCQPQQHELQSDEQSDGQPDDEYGWPGDAAAGPAGVSSPNCVLRYPCRPSS